MYIFKSLFVFWSFDVQSTLPRSNLLGLEGWLRLGEGSTYVRSKTIENKGKMFNIDLRLGRCSTYATFDLGRVDCTCSLITVLVFVAIPCSENAPWGFGGAAHVFLVGICACWLAEQLIVSSSLRSDGAGRVSFSHQYGCTVYVYVLWLSAL